MGSAIIECATSGRKTDCRLGAIAGNEAKKGDEGVTIGKQRMRRAMKTVPTIGSPARARRVAPPGLVVMFLIALISPEAFAQPANDNFASAQVIAGIKSQVPAFATGGATKETNEPDHAANAGGASVWFNWTAPVSAVTVFDTFGSAYNTLLAVYTGSTVNSLTEVAANDNSGGAQSRVTFYAVAGTTYRIAVDGSGGASGNLVLNWTQAGSAGNFQLTSTLYEASERESLSPVFIPPTLPSSILGSRIT
ncbi:MAG: hypothetical protein AB1705_15260, partial [Verrucomicrobiota bacterium]